MGHCTDLVARQRKALHVGLCHDALSGSWHIYATGTFSSGRGMLHCCCRRVQPRAGRRAGGSSDDPFRASSPDPLPRGGGGGGAFPASSSSMPRADSKRDSSPSGQMGRARATSPLTSPPGGSGMEAGLRDSTTGSAGSWSGGGEGGMGRRGGVSPERGRAELASESPPGVCATRRGRRRRATAPSMSSDCTAARACMRTRRPVQHALAPWSLPAWMGACMHACMGAGAGAMPLSRSASTSRRGTMEAGPSLTSIMGPEHSESRVRCAARPFDHDYYHDHLSCPSARMLWLGSLPSPAQLQRQAQRLGSMCGRSVWSSLWCRWPGSANDA